jgi:hypothetical protein
MEASPVLPKSPWDPMGAMPAAAEIRRLAPEAAEQRETAAMMPPPAARETG